MKRLWAPLIEAPESAGVIQMRYEEANAEDMQVTEDIPVHVSRELVESLLQSVCG